MLKKKIGQRISSIRRQKKLSQEELAEASKYSVEFISMIERGVNWPSISGLERIATSLGVNLKDIFDFEIQIDEESETGSTKESRPRGRPRKHLKPPSDQPKRPRGRPRKIKGPTPT